MQNQNKHHIQSCANIDQIEMLKWLLRFDILFVLPNRAVRKVLTEQRDADHDNSFPQSFSEAEAERERTRARAGVIKLIFTPSVALPV